MILNLRLPTYFLLVKKKQKNCDAFKLAIYFTLQVLLKQKKM